MTAYDKKGGVIIRGCKAGRGRELRFFTLSMPQADLNGQLIFQGIEKAGRNVQYFSNAAHQFKVRDMDTALVLIHPCAGSRFVNPRQDPQFLL